jgi:nitrite reductase (NO-forming)
MPPRLSDLAGQLDDHERRYGTPENEDPAVITLGAEAAAVTNRRVFLARASALSLAIPGVGAALAACSPTSGTGQAESGRAAAKQGASAAGGARQPHNSDSRLDSAVLRPEHRAGTSATGAAAGGGNDVPFKRYDPALPPLPASNGVQLHWHAREVPIRVTDDTVVAAWTFEGDFPGPIVHCRVGDTVEFTLTNDVDIPHSMDFHAAQIDPKQAFRSAVKGQSVTYTFRPKWAGGFLYHCGTAPVLMHMGSGMHGAIIVSPRQPMPPAREFVLVQSELYLADAANGLRAFDYQKMLATVPDYVTFNGRPSQYIKEPIRVKAGDRVRFWVVDAGPTHPCHFHVVGEQFDTVYLGAPPGNAIRGVQTFGVPAGGGMSFELVCDIAGEFPFVNHGFGHGQKGAMGLLVVDA